MTHALYGSCADSSTENSPEEGGGVRGLLEGQMEKWAQDELVWQRMGESHHPVRVMPGGLSKSGQLPG